MPEAGGMIELFYYTSPNARKILIALEELRVPYNLIWTNISEGDQFRPEFLRISPNGKIPAIIDQNGPDGAPLAVFESGAILLYLAEKFGRLLPMCGQAAHFHSHAAKHGISQPYAAERYGTEAKRLYGVLDTQLAGREWIAGEFSIADIACFPWTRVAKGQGIALEEFPNVARWSNAIAARPSAKRRPEDDADAPFKAPQGGYSNRQWEILFGRAAQPESVKETTP
jgi:GST-like protein